MNPKAEEHHKILEKTHLEIQRIKAAIDISVYIFVSGLVIGCALGIALQSLLK